MENKKFVKILILIIILAFTLLIVKIKTNKSTVLPSYSSYNNEVNAINEITNNQTALARNSINEEKGKFILSFNNYYQINSSKIDLNQDQQSSNSTNPFSDIKALDIIEHEMKNNYISGIVKNNTGKTLKMLEVSADCYDKDDNKLSVSTTYLSELGPGETWKFRMWTNSDTEKYKNLKATFK